MLDLIIFSSAIAVTKYISQKHPLLRSQSLAALRSHAGQSKFNQNAIHQAPRFIFQACLLLSFWIFSLSILEAAPVTWLAVINRTLPLAFWYRALMSAQCILLLFIHPSLIGFVLGASMCAKMPAPTIKASAAPPSPGWGRTEGMRKRRSPVLIFLNIMWISVRFLLVSLLWRLVRRVAGAMIPYRITRQDSGAARINQKKQHLYCTSGTMLLACISLSISFLSLATIGKCIIDTEASAPIEQHHFQQVKTALDYISLKHMVSIVCAFGMIVASLLNGFGCVSMPHSNLAGLFLKPTPLCTISKVEDDLRYASKQLEAKQLMLADAMQQSPSRRSLSSSYTPSKNKATSDRKRIKQLKEDVVFLKSLVGDMNDDIQEMKRSHQLSLSSRTPLGKVRGALGLIFSIVLVVRVGLAANSFMSILESGDNESKPPNSRDPLTSISLWLLGRGIVSAEQYDLLRQGTSLVLAGVLSVSQVRSFFRVAGALGRRLSRTCGPSLPAACIPSEKPRGEGIGSGSTAILVSSFVMGCYFLACVTVVKMTLPVDYRSSFSAAVGLNFVFNTKLLNMIFFGSACVSTAVFASLFGIQRNNSERYHFESQLSNISSSQLA